jgi:2-polyprenyl-3-methyl-5-hydroxy-6-metoxy-1,4-benzoquinol methylase
MVRVTECPVCQGNSFSDFIKCEDYTVSHETFQLIKCRQCSLVITSPRPDGEKLEKYYVSDDYISHSNKSSGVVDYAYKASRVFTLRWKYNLIQKFGDVKKPGLRILDFGCGTGFFLRECEKNKMLVAGVEPSDKAREMAQQQTSGSIVPNLESVSGLFEIITLWHVLEHVEQLNDTITKLKQHLTETGTMFIAVPNLESPDAKKYQQYWAGYDVPRHLWHFSKRSMERLFNRHNLRLLKIIPLKLDAYYVSMLSEKYKGANKLTTITNAIKEGWKSNQGARYNTQYSSLIYIARK